MTDRIQPNAHQESVWDYPRPPRLQRSSRQVRVLFQGLTVTETSEAYRVLETSHPPTWYIPAAHVRADCLVRADGTSFCEFKGRAVYWNLVVGGETSRQAAWSYPNTNAAFRQIQDYVAFYPSRVDECFVDNIRVESQEGDFYGGWVTPEVVGPFKGGPGTWGW